MNSELIVMVFSGENEAFKALRILEIRQDSFMLGLGELIISTKDLNGNVTIHECRRGKEMPGIPGSELPSLFAEAVLMTHKEYETKLTDMGLDIVFLVELKAAFVIDSSALLTYIPVTALFDRQRFINALSRLNGTLFQTTVPETSVSSLRSLNEW